MALYEQWKEMASMQRTQEESNAFWEKYFEMEKENYRYILEHHQEVIEGSLKELADKFGMEPAVMCGFMDGINTSLVNAVDLDTLTEETPIKLLVDFEKLYFNMLDAKADWLYNLKEWDGVLSKERREEITKEFRRSKMAVSNKVGRNDPCPCGSGKKYKVCCAIKSE